MRAWQFRAVGEPLVLTEVLDPKPGPGEVLIDVKAAGLCHTDIGMLENDAWQEFMTKRPVTLGHEVAGVVAELGEDVRDMTVGIRVGVWANAPEGAPGFTYDGGFAPQMVVPARALVPIPDSVDFAYGAVGMDAGVTPYNAVMRQGGVRANDKVGVIGLGGLGQVGVRLAVLAGANVYVASQRYGDPATRDGVSALVADLGARDVRANIADFDEEFDVVIDFTGTDSSISDAIRSIRSGGTVVLVAMGQRQSKVDTWMLVAKQGKLKGSMSGSKEDIDAVYELMATGKLAPRISPITFSDIPSALDRLRRGDVDGRLVAFFE
ncbi:zinc-binding dehydrogenase [Rhodococcus erythropolis]|uniref:zinc-binding dehydrogenase n=1 Tax=Rhodococcus erythropolis TaxID=1833 RepID=UPI001BE9E697|nr:zinc-binding dehydrogenase [Rhodococcus erythropolis]MBT2266056.1 zinc-binding dehydrogenase [Rhodococcus erythropolis]